MCTSVPTHIHPHLSKLRFVIGNRRRYQRTIFTVGPVHTREIGRIKNHVVAETEPIARRIRGKEYYLYALRKVSNRGNSTPRGTPKGSQVEPKFGLYNIPNTAVNIFTT